MENFKLGCRREEGRCPFSSPRGIRPETLRFRLPVLHNGSYISGNSMVLCLDGLRCGASENTKSRSFTAEEKLKCYRCPWFMTKQKTFFILLTLSRNCLVFFSGLSPHPLLTMVIVISISITYKTESEKGEIGLNFKVLLVSALLSKITTTY